jgi:cystathionine beta-synthase
MKCHTFNERNLVEVVFIGKAKLSDLIGMHLDPPLPMIGTSQPIGSVMMVLPKADGAMVLAHGKPVGIVIPQDLLSRFVASV